MLAGAGEISGPNLLGPWPELLPFTYRTQSLLQGHGTPDFLLDSSCTVWKPSGQETGVGVGGMGGAILTLQRGCTRFCLRTSFPFSLFSSCHFLSRLLLPPPTPTALEGGAVAESGKWEEVTLFY